MFTVLNIPNFLITKITEYSQDSDCREVLAVIFLFFLKINLVFSKIILTFALENETKESLTKKINKIMANYNYKINAVSKVTGYGTEYKFMDADECLEKISDLRLISSTIYVDKKICGNS